VSEASQALWFNAVPLLVVGAAYLGASALLGPALWAERRGASLLDVAIFLVFPIFGLAAVAYGIAVAVDRRPLAGGVWVTLVAIAATGTPAFLALARWRERAAVGSGPRHGRQLQSVAAITTALGRTDDAAAVAEALLDQVERLVEAELACLIVVDHESREAAGVLGRARGRELDWFSEVRIDLDGEPSGVATAALEAVPFAVYDAQASTTLHRQIVEATGVLSVAFVPLVVDERAIAVLVIGSLSDQRVFEPEELSLLQTLAGEAALALDRARSTLALEQALERERFVARLSARVRSELDVDQLLPVAVRETSAALGVDRCFIRLGETENAPIAAQWHLDGLRPIERGAALGVSSLAVRSHERVAIADVEAASELSDPSLGDREALLSLGSRAVLAVPLVVFDQLIGVLSLHRTTAGRWTREEISLTEAVAREIGMALHIAGLLSENDRRIAQQGALLRAAQYLTSDLELGTVLERLVEQVAELVDAPAADCYLYDETRHILRCEAVHGLPDTLVGFEFSADLGAAGEALRTSRPVVEGEYSELDQPVPSEAYADFTSALVAPMRWSETVQGVLGVGSRDERRFTREDADLLEAYAGLASLALANAQAFSERTRQARVQRGFFRIAAVLGQSLSLSATLEALAHAANEALGGSFAAVLMPRAGALELAAAASLPASLRSTFERGVPQAAACLRSAAADSRLFASPDVGRDERFEQPWQELAEAAGFGALLAVPVASPRAESAGLAIVFFSGVRSFVDDDLELGRHLADAARGALERSELFEAERTARALAQQLAHTGGVLGTELDPTAVLDEVVREAPALLGADACAVRTVEGDELVVSAASGLGVEEAVGTRVSTTARLSGDVYQSNSPLAVQDGSADERFLAADPILGAGYAAYLGVPLTGPEPSPAGVLAVYARRGRSWRPEEIEALQALAANTSAALANAELYSRVSLEKERSVAILANIADGIVAVDRDGNVVLWNSAAEQITGIPQEEAAGRTTAEVLQRRLESDDHEEDRPAQRLVSITRGSEEVWLSLSEAVMRDPLGAVAGRIFAFRDISADRMVEHVKSDFVAAVSHELRTPLTSIYGFAETLLREDVPFDEEERLTFLKYIASESERLIEIVDQLLNVARLDTGDLHVELGRIDVGSVVSEVVKTAGESGVMNGHRFEVDLPDEPLAAEGDRDKMRQVFSILLENALRYSPQGGTVTVGARRKADRVEVSVVDEGIGIPAAERDRIFRKFYRAEAAARDGAAGTGLGLFIAKELVNAMGGRIWVDSVEGEGSSFSFELPAARE
jgi:PAS domain S-box-containing protein